MPVVSVSHEVFDIQITVKSPLDLTVVQVVNILLSLLPDLVRETMMVLQKYWLHEDLGPSGYPGNQFDDAEKGCPDCGSGEANRKIWRHRILGVPTLGEIDVALRQIECRGCGRTWTPYASRLGLKHRQKYSPDVLMEGVQHALEASYQRASNKTDAQPSATTIHRALNAWSPAPDGPATEYRFVMMDATDVPKWKESGQITLTIAHEITRAPRRYNRPALNRRVVALAVGKEADIKAFLKEVRIKSLMHDGGLRVDGLCEVEGRCKWHVPYTVRSLLYKDGIKGKDNKERCEHLRTIVFDDELTVKEQEKRLKEWIKANEVDAPSATTHVQRAMNGLKNVVAHPELFDVETTGPLEREMVEINKRFENGGGWTQPGAEAMLRHLQLWKYDRDEWERQVMKNGGSAVPYFEHNSVS